MDGIKRERDDGYGRAMKLDTEPWRGSSGFGLADILNRSSSSSSSSVPPPTFSLPSLHSFGKPLITKSDISMAPTRSLLHEDQESLYSQQRSASSSPARQSPLRSSQRIAPAPAEEEEAEQEADAANANANRGAAQPIRGGRWTADEHERFLEGFRIHGHKWKRVQQVVRTRSVTQVRTHAQKYLLKVAKLKAEKKQGGKTAEMTTLAAADQSPARGAESADESNTAPSTPEHNANADSPRKTPRKKVRRLEHGYCDPVDQQYIAAAATTLCFLMSQKIDSLFDPRNDVQQDGNKSDLEPYDCYSQQTRLSDDRDGSRKRSYMHFITDQQGDMAPSYDHAATHGEPSSYTIEGSKLCS